MQATFSRHHRILSSTLLAVFAAFPASSPAMQPLVTAEAETLGAGKHQVELAFKRDRIRVDGETARVRSVPLTYTHGLTDSLDVYVGTEHLRLRGPEERASGFGNTTLGAVWQFFGDEDSGTSLAVRPEIAIPVSAHRENRGLGTGKTSGSLTFLLSQEVPFGAVHLNAGVARSRYRHSEETDDASATSRYLSVAPVWNVSERWKLALDVGVDWSRSQGRTVRSRYAEIGAVYSPSEGLDLSVGFIRTTDNERPKSKTNGLILGVSWTF